MNDGNDLLRSILRTSQQRPVASSPQSSFLLPFLPPIKPAISPVQSAFLRLKKNLELNDSFQETITQNHTAVREALERFGLKTKLIGSLQRDTKIQPRPDDQFDIDILVEMGSFYGWTTPGFGTSPKDAISTLKALLSQNKVYKSMNPKEDEPTVLFRYENGVKVELVPAYVDRIGYSPNGVRHFPVGRAYWVSKNGIWELADYDYDAEYISTKNRECNGWLIPTIKMLKAMKRIHFPEMSSIYLEILAVEIISFRITLRKILGLNISYPDLIREFFNGITPVSISAFKKIPNSHTPGISLNFLSYLRIPNTFEAIRALCNGIHSLDQNNQLKYWKYLFGDPFTLEDTE